MSPVELATVTLVAENAVLDDLELLRSGVIGEPTVGPQELVSLSLDSIDVGEDADEVRIDDSEGAPIATVPLARTSDGGLVIEGRPRWHSHRSSRPYEALHVQPEEIEASEITVVVDRPIQYDNIGAEPGDSVLILALASTDGDGPVDDLATVRAAQDWAARVPQARVVVVPLGRGARCREEKLQCIAAAYARGGHVLDLTQVPATGRPQLHTEVSARGSGMEGGAVVFFTGLSGSGKSTIAREVRNWLVEQRQTVTLLDGDVVRRHLSAGLGFTVADRDRNIRRIGWVAAEIAAHGGLAICSPIAPFDVTREQVRQMVENRGGRFLLVHVSTPLAECERRDRKGLYARARKGEISDFTGISSPYEPPRNPDLRMDTTEANVHALRDRVLAMMGHRKSVEG